MRTESFVVSFICNYFKHYGYKTECNKFGLFSPQYKKRRGSCGMNRGSEWEAVILELANIYFKTLFFPMLVEQGWGAEWVRCT